MENTYFSQRRRNIRKNQQKKMVIVIAVAVIMVVLVLIGLIRVIANENENEEGTQGTTQISMTPNPQENEQNSSDTNENLNIETTITPEATLTPTNTPTPTPTEAPLGPIIAIDPGHGGEIDLGSVRGEYKEKHANLAIALFLRDILEERGYRTYMIREADVAVANETRSGLAKDNGASLYVSVHINSLEEDSNATKGVEVWYCDLFDTDSDVLAQYVVDELANLTGTKNRGIKLSNRLIVLKENTLPACLVECGFISSEEERTKLFTEEYQKIVAEGIANGIEKFMPLESE